LPLSEPLPLPHLATWTFLGEERREFEDAIFMPTAEAGPIPDDFKGSIDVSIRIWQHKRDLLAEVGEEQGKLD
jgi:hypothetical protein